MVVEFHRNPVNLGLMNRVANSILRLTTTSGQIFPKFQPAATTLMARKRPLSENCQDNPKKMERTNGGSVEKSQSDKKSYRVVTLENCLKVLLISDPSPITEATQEDSEDDELSVCSESEDGDDTAEKLAAAALCVNVGSFSDHGRIQGLAHFLEHMIFMGSAKFPLENEYDKYIKQCGGSDNADTNYEETSFYFEVAEKYLEGALDRFANLFTEPLMLKDTMNREREAVDSEFKLKINNENARKNQVVASFGNPQHPSSVFAWGNLKTLKDTTDDDTLYEQVHQFRRRHYSAHRMALVMQARLPLDVLEDLAVKYFSNIPNNRLPGDDFAFANHLNAFNDEFYNQVCFIKPKSNLTKIELTWCMPSMVKDYKSKPHHYVAFVLGFEGKGSLLAYLRNKEWALELLCGSVDAGFEHNSLFMLYGITVNLTDSGFANIDKVLAAIFAYIKLLRRCGADDKLFAELQQIEATSFRYQTEKTALDNVEELCANMHYYPTEHIISGSELYFEYDAQAIENVIGPLNSGKFNLMVTSSRPYQGIVYNKKEQWFGTEYTTIDMPNEWKHLWETAPELPELHLPEPNKFITTNFEILPPESAKNHPEYPIKIVNNEIMEMWYRQDTKFLLPFGYMYFYIITPFSMKSAKHSVMMNLFSLLCKHHLVEELYPAKVAGLGYYLFSLEKGFVLQVNGYNEKLHLLVEKIVSCMINLKKNMRESVFNIFKVQLAKNLFNIMIKPGNLNKDVRLGIVQKVHFGNHEKFNVLPSVSFEDMQQFVENVFDEIQIQALVQGNVSRATAERLSEAVVSQFKFSKPIKDLTTVETRAHQIPLGEHTCAVQSFRQNDTNTVVTNFYQVGGSSIILMCMLDLLDLLMEDPIFDILRTKEQLGYDVSGSVRANYGILGFAIQVSSQEDKFRATFVEERIEKFREAFREILENMADEEFDLFKNSLIKLKLVADTELKDEVSRNWAEITTEDYVFDRLPREVECIHKITKSDMIGFYRSLMDDTKNMRKLSTVVVGHEKGVTSAGDGETEIEEIDFDNQKHLQFLNLGRPNTVLDLDTIRTAMPVYPVTKTSLK